VSEADPGGVIAAATRAPGADGRRFAGTRPIRLGDVDPAGRLRLDAVARHLQDVATDDTVDAGIGDDTLTWVVRRAAVAARRWPRYLERVGYTTFCSGTGPRWAERRTSGRGTEGADLEAVALWACIDVRSGRARSLPEGFDQVWGSTTGGRTVSARLLHPAAPETLPGRPWQVRATDLDVLGHVNNAVHWAAIEDELARLLPGLVPTEAECEYRVPVELGDAVTLRSLVEGGTLRTWMVSARGVHASAVVRGEPETRAGAEPTSAPPP
jgi:acyl-ACP thioesterase